MNDSGDESLTAGNSRDIFTGTARYYSQYRPRYPDELFPLLCEKFALNAQSRVLDLGCGPGTLSLRLAPYVNRLIAIDPLDHMLAEAGRLAAEQHVTNVEWIAGESGQLLALAGRIGEIELTMMGRSFHWMDREQILNDLFTITQTGGGVAVIDDSGPANGKETPWREIIWEVIREWLGEERRAGPDRTFPHSRESHEPVIQRSLFKDYEAVQLPVERTWTLDDIMGYLYSTSHCSLPVLGKLKDGFEADMRKKLLEYDSSGRYAETAVVEVKMAWKR